MNMLIKKFIGCKHFVKFILLFGFIIILLTSQIILRNFPNSADEYSYLISAKLFSVGRLSVPSPPLKQFFDFYHIINDGKFYGKYPPTWPFFLMFGVLIGFPMLINLIFAVLTLLLIYSIAKNMFSEKVARISLLLMVVSPYFIFNSASYFSHPSSLFFLSLFAYLYVKNLKKNKEINWFLAGITLGLSFNIRLLEPIVIGACFFLHYLFVIKKNKKPIKSEIKNAFLFLAGFLIFFCIFLLYNYLQTGNALLTPFNKYNPRDKLGFNNGYSNSFSWAVKYNLYERLINLNIWIPFCLLFMLLALANTEYKKDHLFLLFFSFCFLLFAYFFYAAYPGNEYGPRYLYSSSFSIFILLALGIEKIGKLTERVIGRKHILLLVIILLNLSLFMYFSFLFHNQINQRMELYDKAKSENISNAIVFLNSTSAGFCSGTMPALDLTRNGIYFNNSVLYVNNLGKRNILLAKTFPERKYYLWQCKKIYLSYIKLLNFEMSKNINCSFTELNLSQFLGNLTM